MNKKVSKMFSLLFSFALAAGTLNTVPYTASAKGNIDFEFTNKSAVEDFSADGGSVSYENGRLVWSLGSGNTLTSPEMKYISGTAYGVKLEYRNTFCVRMANKTDAAQLRLYFTTSSGKTFDQSRSEVFDIKPQSGDETYLFNLSGNAKATGKLTGFRFELLGASGGSLEIDAITFEREKPVYDYAGELVSCRVSGDSVIVKGTLDGKYSGKTVDLYETLVENYTEKLNQSEKIASVTADGTSFEITVPFMNGKISRLSSMFLLGVDGTRVCDRFTIENWRDLLINPYAFETKGKTVKVTDAPYSAKGDGYTNDTDAIQKAIDDVSKAGGGKVVVPGTDDEYGRRYIITTVRIKENVELHLEKGSVLWQSPRPADYSYEVIYGHDISVPGVNWTHAGLCKNYPLVYAYKANHIKLTGEGTIRSVDTGSECIDSVSGDAIWIGCEGRIHLISIAMQYCDDVEISDVHIRRANCYHLSIRNCHRVFIANVDMREATCASGDGIGVSCGNTDVEIDRCYLYSNDDAVTLCVSYNDPRGMTWWNATPDKDNSIRRVNVRSCNLFGGHGITFIPWGTDDPDLSNEIIEKINVTDCVLSGGGYAVGTWPDNPYFGRDFDNTETDDYSPVQDVTILNNKYRGGTDLEVLKMTGLVTDCGLKSADNFLYGDFEHRDVEDSSAGKISWKNGLSNWETSLNGVSCDCGKEASDGSDSVSAGSEGSNHFGVLKGKASMYQGLYMNSGMHYLTVDVRMPEKGTATLFVRDRITGETIASKEIRANKDSWFTNVLQFTLEKGCTADIGVETESGTFYIDNANVTSQEAWKKKYFTENFENGEPENFIVSGMSAITEDGNTFMRSEGGLGGLEADSKYTDFKITYRMRYHSATSQVDGNFGICCRRKGSNEYFFEYNTVYSYFQLRRFQGNNTSSLFNKNVKDVPAGEWFDVTFTAEGNHFVWTVNGKTYIDKTDDKLKSGAIFFNFYNSVVDIDDITIEPLGSNAEPENEAPEPPEGITEAEFVPDPENEDPKSGMIIPIIAGCAVLAGGAIAAVALKKRKKK